VEVTDGQAFKAVPVRGLARLLIPLIAPKVTGRMALISMIATKSASSRGAVWRAPVKSGRGVAVTTLLSLMALGSPLQTPMGIDRCVKWWRPRRVKDRLRLIPSLAVKGSARVDAVCRLIVIGTSEFDAGSLLADRQRRRFGRVGLRVILPSTVSLSLARAVLARPDLYFTVLPAGRRGRAP
jgi:hypothetical protein